MREFNKADHWNSAADRYEKTAHPYTARYVEAALAHVPLTPASRVLDIAAGTGALALASQAHPERARRTAFPCHSGAERGLFDAQPGDPHVCREAPVARRACFDLFRWSWMVRRRRRWLYRPGRLARIE